MVSCEYPRYQCELVRLVHDSSAPPPPPLKLPKEPSTIDGEHTGRKQVIHAGSFGMVPCEKIVPGECGLAAQAMIYPTTPGKGRQSLISKWDESCARGFALIIGEDGALALEISDGSDKIWRCSTGKAMLPRHWYLAAASYDAQSGETWVEQKPLLKFPKTGDSGRKLGAFAKNIDWDSDAPLMFAATWGGTDAGRPVGKALYNGKIDRPRLFDAPCADDKPVLSGKKSSRLAGAWDFAADIGGDTFADLTGNGLHGKLVNMPTRAVTGHNFTGEEMCWRNTPEQWSAVHFHDDDVYDAGWLSDFELAIPDSMRSGIYAVRLHAEEQEQFITFVVRPARGTANAKLLYLFPLATHMAYANEHLGTDAAQVQVHLDRATVLQPHQIFLNEHREYGHSLYDCHSDGSGVCYSSRLRPIVNMRPNTEASFEPAETTLWLLTGDLHIASWLENLGEEYDVATDEDLHKEGEELLGKYRTVITGSHPEYCSKRMRDAIANFTTQKGGRLMYMGGNGFYWRIAFHPTLPGIIETRRAECGSRTWEAPAGEYYHSFTGEHGGLWRRQGRTAPNTLVGNGFIAQGFDTSTYYRKTADAGNERVSFMFAGVEGDVLGNFGLIGGGAAGIEIGLPRHIARNASQRSGGGELGATQRGHDSGA